MVLHAMVVRRQIKDFLFMTIGIAMYVVGFVCFHLPYSITTGGVTGLGAVIFYATGIPVQVTYFVVNIFLLLLAFRILGLKFMVNTIYAVVTMTILLTVMQNYTMNTDGTFPKILGDQSFMSCVVGAVLEGIGIGIVFLNNGSTGGTDIIAAIVNKYRDTSLGQAILFADILIISSGYLVFHNVELLIFGFCTMVIETTALDNFLNMVRQSVQFMIFSKEYEYIAHEIARTGRGVTILDGSGYYTRNTVKVLVVLCRRRESNHIFNIIRTIDPKAFVSQAKVAGVFGNGFDKIKGK